MEALGPDLLGDIPAHSRGFGTRWSLKFSNSSYFYDSMTEATWKLSAFPVVGPGVKRAHSCSSLSYESSSAFTAAVKVVPMTAQHTQKRLGKSHTENLK